MAIPTRKVGDIYTVTECVDGKKVHITYKVTQIVPRFRTIVIKEEKTEEKCQ